MIILNTIGHRARTHSILNITYTVRISINTSMLRAPDRFGWPVSARVRGSGDRFDMLIPFVPKSTLSDAEINEKLYATKVVNNLSYRQLSHGNRSSFDKFR